MPTFFAFWEAAKDLSAAEQGRRFRAEVIARYPEVYAPSVLGLRGGDPEALLEQRLSAWLPKLPRLVPRMRELASRFDADVDRAVEHFRSSLPDFRWSGTCFLFASIDGMNGGLREVTGQPALVFGLDVIANDTGTMPLPVLFAHELFHAHQLDAQAPSEGPTRVADALWGEGLATFASVTLTPGTADRVALPMSHLHDPSRPALDLPERRVFLADVMPAHARTLGGELRAALDAQDEATYATFFLGRAAPKLGERPVRSGYWFGLHVARAIAGRRALADLARLPAARLRGDIGAALDEVIARYA